MPWTKKYFETPGFRTINLRFHRRLVKEQTRILTDSPIPAVIACSSQHEGARVAEKDIMLLAVNAGSSSIRLAVFAFRDQGHMERVAGAHMESDRRDAAALLRRFMQEHSLSGITHAVHRVVHGGTKLQTACLIDSGVESEIERLEPLAPLHNPLALRWIRACRAVLTPPATQFAVFDTAFYAGLPDVARTYALPWQMTEHHGLRRFGFHGLAHQAMWNAWRTRRGATGGGRVISLQLGAGCSVTATEDGVARDTSMGFSPVEGLMMATRCGDMDAGLITFLQRTESWSPQETDRILNDASGLLGVSGISADMRALLVSTDPRARLAVAMYCYRARKYIGAYLAALGGVDAILFGGGVGENAAAVRERILAGMEWAGIRLDQEANISTRGTENRISRADSAVAVWVCPVDEAHVMAQEAMTAMAAPGRAV
jgi:acetate kinase